MDKSATAVSNLQKAPQNVPMHCCIISTLVSIPEGPSTSSTSSSCPIVIVPELAIPTDACLECINRPGGGKDYICCLCSFHHTNYDCILTHISKHLDVTIGCLGCRKGFQNMASLCIQEERFIRFKLLHPPRNSEFLSSCFVYDPCAMAQPLIYE